MNFSHENIFLSLAPMEGVMDWVFRDLITSLDRVSSDRVSTDRVSTDRVSTDRVSTDRVSTDRVASDRVATDFVASDRASADRDSASHISADHCTADLVAIDQVTTEFIRVTHNLHPNKVFYRYAPELHTGSRTRSGTPLFIQLLGGQPEPMAMNAARAAELGALGIDLNFGCPAKTVNRHDGGASLLKFPERLFKITQTVRAAVPSHIPVTTKMRLGFENTSLCLENAHALAEGGSSGLTVHCRTKVQGYKPPAHWEWISLIKEKVKIPVTANGDITDLESLKKCHSITHCDRFMIGRAALKNPHLFSEIRQKRMISPTWHERKHLVLGFYRASTEYVNAHFATARTKQFLRNLTFHPTQSAEASEVFQQTKAILKPKEFALTLERLLQ